MHVKQIHKPEPHVLRRAGIAGGGFKSSNLSQIGTQSNVNQQWWNQHTEALINYLYESQANQSQQIDDMQATTQGFSIPQSFKNSPAQFLEQLTHLPNQAGKVVRSQNFRQKMKIFKPLLLSHGSGGGSKEQQYGQDKGEKLMPIVKNFKLRVNQLHIDRLRSYKKKRVGKTEIRSAGGQQMEFSKNYNLSIPIPQVPSETNLPDEHSRTQSRINRNGDLSTRIQSPLGYRQQQQESNDGSTFSKPSYMSKTGTNFRIQQQQRPQSNKVRTAQSSRNNIVVCGLQKRIMSNRYNGVQITRPSKLPRLQKNHIENSMNISSTVQDSSNRYMPFEGDDHLGMIDHFNSRNGGSVEKNRPTLNNNNINGNNDENIAMKLNQSLFQWNGLKMPQEFLINNSLTTRSTSSQQNFGGGWRVSNFEKLNSNTSRTAYSNRQLWRQMQSNNNGSTVKSAQKSPRFGQGIHTLAVTGPVIK